MVCDEVEFTLQQVVQHCIIPGRVTMTLWEEYASGNNSCCQPQLITCCCHRPTGVGEGAGNGLIS
jgi:hypothetical protein